MGTARYAILLALRVPRSRSSACRRVREFRRELRPVRPRESFTEPFHTVEPRWGIQTAMRKSVTQAVNAGRQHMPPAPGREGSRLMVGFVSDRWFSSHSPTRGDEIVPPDRSPWLSPVVVHPVLLGLASTSGRVGLVGDAGWQGSSMVSNRCSLLLWGPARVRPLVAGCWTRFRSGLGCFRHFPIEV